MNKYGKAAKLAVAKVKGGQTKDPVTAWNNAVREIFPNSVSSQKKGCPKNAFLGLCEEGMVKDVSSGSYTRSIDNKKYAVAAVTMLNHNPKLASDHKALWTAVMNGVEKKQNSQMDVVIALWNQGLIA